MAKEKEMYPFARRALRTRYPVSKNWKIISQDNRGTYIPDFVVEKKGRKYTYRIPVEVKIECVATKAHINQLNRYSRNLAGPNISIQNKILIYPAYADTSLVPDNIEVIYLKSFKCE